MDSIRSNDLLASQCPTVLGTTVGWERHTGRDPAVGVHARVPMIVGTVLTLVVPEWCRWIERRSSPRDEDTEEE